MNKPRLVIVVSGGVVTGMYGNQKIDVQILDHDNMSADTDVSKIKEGVSKQSLDFISTNAELDNLVNQEVQSHIERINDINSEE
jgi:hypothetical protein